MKLIGVKSLAGACCLLVPFALGAQTPPVDPTSPATSPSSTVGSASPTSTQMSPGTQHQHVTQATQNFASGAGMSSADDGQVAKDKMFLETASQGGMAEVQLGQLASEKGQSPKVKAFGQKMVTDHTKLNNELKPFADKMGVPPPTKLSAEDQAEYDKLSQLSGADFDKEYVADMMKDHAMDLKEFKQEASQASDPELKAAVMKGEKVIAQHKRIIDGIGASMNVTASS